MILHQLNTKSSRSELSSNAAMVLLWERVTGLLGLGDLGLVGVSVGEDAGLWYGVWDW